MNFFETPLFEEDEKDIWVDEMVAGVKPSLPDQFSIGVEFENQGAYPYCGAFATINAVKGKLQNEMKFSQADLFHKAGGTKRGSWVRKVLNVAKDIGLSENNKLPMPINVYDNSEFDNHQQMSKSIRGEYKIGGYARVNPDAKSMREACIQYGGVITGVSADKSYFEYGHKRITGSEINHLVYYSGYDVLKSPEIFDSLEAFRGFDGYHYLDSNYNFEFAYVLLDIPSDWKAIRDEARKEFKTCLNRYGSNINQMLEVKNENSVYKELKRINDPKALATFKRFRKTYINAITYGDYSITYWKKGRRYSGDILNAIWHYNRTGKHIFNLNKKRNNQ